MRDISNYYFYKLYSDKLRLLDLPRMEFWQNIHKVNHIPFYEKEPTLNFDWEKYEKSYCLPFEDPEKEKQIELALLNSILSKHEYLIVELPSEFPLVEVPTHFFCTHWNEFVMANHDMGFVAASPDFAAVMEFTHVEHFLYSNFKIL